MGCHGGRLGVVFLVFFAQVDAAFQERAFFDGEALGVDIAGNGAIAADVDAVAYDQVAFDFAHDYDFTGGDCRHDHAVAAYGDAAFGHIDGAFDAAVHVESFCAGDFALDDDGTADGGLFG